MQHTFAVYAPTAPAVSCRCSAWGNADRPMRRQDDGTWTLTADLPDGTHDYAYHLRSLSWFSRDAEVDIPDPLGRWLTADEERSSVTVPPPPERAEGYAWRHDWVRHPGHERIAIYEVFVRDVAPAGSGTFGRVVDRLDHIAGLGFTALELMPLGTADRQKGWGYTPRFFYAVEPRYGTEADLCRLVDEAHRRGLLVFIDGVYNHASRDCPLAHIDHDCYFHHAPKDPSAAWGPQFNYTLNIPGTTEFPARHFIKQKVEHWINRYHIDGIRYDAVSQVRNRAFLGELTAWAREKGGGKPFFAIAECLPLRAEEVGPQGPMDAWWREDFHKRLRPLLAGTWDGDALERCFDCRRDGFCSGKDVVNYLASHDTGHTVRALLDAGLDEDAAVYRMQLGLTVLFTAVGLPMVWMGDEGGCAGPASQEPQPVDWEAMQADPRRRALLAVTAILLRLRAEHGALRGDNCTVLGRDDERGLLVVHRWDEAGGRVVVAVHGMGGDIEVEQAMPASGRWREALGGGEAQVDGEGPLRFRLGGWQPQVWVLQP